MGHVFVSYSHKDQSIMRDIVDRLRDAGTDVWVDISGIKPGEDWFNVLYDALAASDALILIWSLTAAESRNVRSEWGYALQNSVPIIPIQVHPEFVPLPQEMGNLYLGNWWDESRREETLSQILSAIPSSSKQPEPQPPIIPASKGYVFISYAKQNLAFVEKLRKFMEVRKYAYWDYKKTKRQFNKPFHLELEDAVSGAVLVLCVVSPDWKKSNWSAKEYLFADYIGKPIFVLKVVDPGPTLLIIDKTPIDFEADEKLGFDQLDQALKLDGLA